VHGGDRLPWVEPESPGTGADNFTPLSSLDWQVHVYGEASAEIRNACDSAKIAAACLCLASAMRRTGLRRDAVYLVRPDGYVALANAAASAQALTAYVDVRKLKPRAPSRR
jgi:hypothetical protein